MSMNTARRQTWLGQLAPFFAPKFALASAPHHARNCDRHISLPSSCAARSISRINNKSQKRLYQGDQNNDAVISCRLTKLDMVEASSFHAIRGMLASSVGIAVSPCATEALLDHMGYCECITRILVEEWRNELTILSLLR